MLNTAKSAFTLSAEPQDDLPTWLQALGHETISEMTLIIEATEKNQSLIESEVSVDELRDRRIRRQNIARIVRDLVDTVLQHLRQPRLDAIAAGDEQDIDSLYATLSAHRRLAKKNDEEITALKATVERRTQQIERLRREFLQQLLVLKEQLYQRERLGGHYTPDNLDHLSPFQPDEADAQTVEPSGIRQLKAKLQKEWRAKMKELQRQFDAEKMDKARETLERERHLQSLVDESRARLREKEQELLGFTDKLEAERAAAQEREAYLTHQLGEKDREWEEKLQQLTSEIDAKIAEAREAFEAEAEEARLRRQEEFEIELSAKLEEAREEADAKLKEQADAMAAKEQQRQLEIDELKSELDAERGKMATIMAEAAAQAAQANAAEMDKIRDDLSRAMDEIAELKKALTTSEMDMREVKRERDALLARVEQLSAALQGHSGVAEDIARRADMAAADLDRVKRRFDSGALDEEQLSDMQMMLQQKDSMIFQLRDQLKAVTEEVSNVTQAYQQVLTEYNDLMSTDLKYTGARVETATSGMQTMPVEGAAGEAETEAEDTVLYRDARGSRQSLSSPDIDLPPVAPARSRSVTDSRRRGSDAPVRPSTAINSRTTVSSTAATATEASTPELSRKSSGKNLRVVLPTEDRTRITGVYELDVVMQKDAVEKASHVIHGASAIAASSPPGSPLQTNISQNAAVLTAAAQAIRARTPGHARGAAALEVSGTEVGKQKAADAAFQRKMAVFERLASRSHEVLDKTRGKMQLLELERRSQLERIIGALGHLRRNTVSIVQTMPGSPLVSPLGSPVGSPVMHSSPKRDDLRWRASVTAQSIMLSQTNSPVSVEAKSVGTRRPSSANRRLSTKGVGTEPLPAIQAQQPRVSKVVNMFIGFPRQQR